jgi:hypothetical protein
MRYTVYGAAAGTLQSRQACGILCGVWPPYYIEGCIESFDALLGHEYNLGGPNLSCSYVMTLVVQNWLHRRDRASPVGLESQTQGCQLHLRLTCFRVSRLP